ncbi:MAG: 1-(5-phosphoribosyl)-5-[(5-phosphoribosylamino)methylideneamino]imidazole-4-carboxamide isomerase [Alphaproteobacteria bacterium]|nr:1-(5-phosphoribosyl)-5-[(5-phosphoribosylamino)methylideneamino]imidazole-4-carboxamide isomerase [Alphaproteobacteria bacterium]
MILFPAIDLKDGQCVRLLHGRMDQATTFNDNPSAQAEAFFGMGFDHLHVVDLNGAFAGRPVNEAAVRGILASTVARVQLGGGIRDLAMIERWLISGVYRVVLGTVAVRDPDLVKSAARLFPDRVAVGVDCRGGQVAVAGWGEDTSVSAVELAKAFEGCGVSAIIVTDIGRDGAKTGVNIDLTGQIADAVTIPVIASGGVRDVQDLVDLKKRPGRPIGGAILGRSLYDGDIQPELALKTVC